MPKLQSSYPEESERFSFIKDYLKNNEYIVLFKPDFFEAFHKRFPMYSMCASVSATHDAYVRQAYDDLNMMVSRGLVSCVTITKELAKESGIDYMPGTKRYRLKAVNPFLTKVG